MSCRKILLTLNVGLQNSLFHIKMSTTTVASFKCIACAFVTAMGDAGPVQLKVVQAHLTSTCRAFELSLSPPLLVMAPTPIGVTSSSTFKLYNKSPAPVQFTWASLTTSEGTIVAKMGAQNGGTVSAGSYVTIEASCAARQAGKLHGFLECRIAHGTPLRLPVSGTEFFSNLI